MSVQNESEKESQTSNKPSDELIKFRNRYHPNIPTDDPSLVLKLLEKLTEKK